jgi:3-methyladenine DNA glycosylase Tag
VVGLEATEIEETSPSFEKAFEGFDLEKFGEWFNSRTGIR